MISKDREKTKAVSLRKRGSSYTQILKQVHVAKSTLSLWLREVGLSKPQKQKLTERRLAAARRGGLKKREMRIEKTAIIKDKAKKEVPKLIKDPFWLAGVLLYWAEGSKQKEWSPSEKVAFSNMDPDMIFLFHKWLKSYFMDVQLKYELYIHMSGDIDSAKQFWSNLLGIRKDRLLVYLKKHNPKTTRKNTGKKYFGGVRIVIQKSTDINRRIEGWTEGVIEYLK